MEGIKVKEKGQFPGRWAYAIPILVIILGLMVSAWILIGAGFWNYPATIEKAFGEEQHHLKVPGSKDVTLTRSGAYGIYYEYNLEACQGEKSQTPPAIECSLTSKSTGAVTQAVPEYVETNRYEAKDQGRMGVLIMSLTVDKPDDYTFACRYQKDMPGSGTTVALGPNYGWEILRVVGSVILPFFGVVIAMCGSVLFALLIVIVVAVKRNTPQRHQTG
jgi:hypothetical protein